MLRWLHDDVQNMQEEPHRHDVELSIVQEEASDESPLVFNDAMSTSSADERESTMSWTF